MPSISVISSLLLLVAIASASIYQDLQAKPYYDFRFTQNTVTNIEAHALRTTEQSEYKYRVLNNGKDRFLCAIPNITRTVDVPSPETKQQMARDEKEEAARASERGWELLNGLEGACLYWISGWWSYEYCYSDGVRQFHPLPPQPGLPMFPPREDPNAGSYVLGRRPKSTDQNTGVDKAVARVRDNGASKSLVVKFERGTYCPLINSERHIEIQFQCSPSTNDHILYVKETSSCSYLMVIQTARLCHDVAFQEAATEPANIVACSRISDATLPEIDANVDSEEPAAKPEEHEQEVVAAEATAIENVEDDKSTETKSGRPALRTKRHDSPLAMAQDIAKQIEAGTLNFDGKSLFEATKEDLKYDVELQDEDGETLGVVHMSVINGNVVVEMSDLAAATNGETHQPNKGGSKQRPNEDMPEFMKKKFKEFLGHDEL